MAEWLALLETVGNQRFIFATNRLREIIGASEMVARAGGAFALSAAAQIETGASAAAFADMATSAGRETAALVRAMRGPKAPRVASGAALEAIVATSGKALFRAASREHAMALVAAVTERVARELPGLTVCGAVVAVEGGDASAADAAVAAAHRRALANRSRIPPDDRRFLGMPFLQPCDSSGSPAQTIGALSRSERGPISAAVRTRRAMRREGARRMACQAGEERGRQRGLASKLQNLEDAGADWLAIIHADGNGFGQLFLRFGRLAGAATAEEYFAAYRDFSLSLDLCGASAFRAALSHVEEDGAAMPVIPLVLGGDDLTVICEGRAALAFTAAYLRGFESATLQDTLLGCRSTIPTIAAAAVTQGYLANARLGAAAGVAITKPHYPFHRGYELAEELLRSAKAVKRHVGAHASALDFHLLFDGVATSLQDLRASWTAPSAGGTPRIATMRPLLISTGIDVAAHPWAARRAFDEIDEQARALQPRDGEKGALGLPRSQQHALRAAMLRSPESGEAQLRLIRDRYQTRVDWRAVLGADPPRLFCDVDGVVCSRMLDMMEMNDLRHPTATA